MFKRHNPEDQRAASSLPYSVLLQMGFTEPAHYCTAGALLPHRSTLTACAAVHISVALSLKSPSPDVIRHPALWSSDFPLTRRPAIVIHTHLCNRIINPPCRQGTEERGASFIPPSITASREGTECRMPIRHDRRRGVQPVPRHRLQEHPPY